MADPPPPPEQQQHHPSATPSVGQAPQAATQAQASQLATSSLDNTLLASTRGGLLAGSVHIQHPLSPVPAWLFRGHSRCVTFFSVSRYSLSLTVSIPLSHTLSPPVRVCASGMHTPPHYSLLFSTCLYVQVHAGSRPLELSEPRAPAWLVRQGSPICTRPLPCSQLSAERFSRTPPMTPTTTRPPRGMHRLQTAIRDASPRPLISPCTCGSPPRVRGRGRGLPGRRSRRHG